MFEFEELEAVPRLTDGGKDRQPKGHLQRIQRTQKRSISAVSTRAEERVPFFQVSKQYVNVACRVGS